MKVAHLYSSDNDWDQTDFNLEHSFFEKRSDSEIWSSFKSGDENSLIYIYKKYGQTMFNYARQFCRKDETVLDAIQDLFAELIDRSHRLGDVQSIKGYLFKCIKRKVLSHMKKSEKEELMDASNQAFQIMFKSQLPTLEGISDEVAEKLGAAVNLLPIQQREIILLHYYEGLSYEEISGIMDIKVKSARMLVYRAIKNLRSNLGKNDVALLLPLSVSLLS